MESVLTLDWVTSAGAECTASVPLSNRTYVVLASSIWQQWEGREEALESASTDVDAVTYFIAVVDEEARKRSSASSAETNSDESIVALLHQLVGFVLKAAQGSSPAHLLRAHTSEGCARLAIVARAKEFAVAGMKNVQLAQTKPKLALLEAFEAGSAAGFLHFGGQGYAALPELQSDVRQWPSVVLPLVEAASAALTAQVQRASEAGLGRYYGQGFDVQAWLDGSVVPSDAYLQSAPISFPLIGLAQCAHYASLVSLLGLEEAYGGWDKALQAMAGATGHSQGVVVAAAAAASHDVQSFLAASVAAVKLLFWQGVRMQEAYEALPPAAKMPPPPKPAPGAAPPSTEEPAPMLAVSGLTPAQLQVHVDGVCKLVAKVEAGAAALKGQPAPAPGPAPLTVSLVNGHTSCVVSGRPAHCAALYHALDAIRAPPGADQARVPHSSRKPVVKLAYLRVSAPFHSALLAPAVAKAVEDCAKADVGAALSRSSLRLPVYSTDNGRDLRTAPSTVSISGGMPPSLVEELLTLMTTVPVDWPAAIKAIHSPAAGIKKATHVLDLGPGGANAGARMTARLLEGTGVPVVVATTAAVTASQANEATSEDADAIASASASAAGTEGFPLFDLRVMTTPRADVLAAVAKASPDWAALHGPRLAKRSCDGALLLDTAYSRLLGRAPIMVAGMTPCTSYYGLPLVSACTNAGFHAELACGGLPRPSIFRERIAKLQSMLAPGQGIGLNMLFLNARQWAFQYPMVSTLIAEGVPIETVCIAAGVPSLDNGIEVVKTLARAGVKYVSFKPGSVDAIKRTLEIAAGVAPSPWCCSGRAAVRADTTPSRTCTPPSSPRTPPSAGTPTSCCWRAAVWAALPVPPPGSTAPGPSRVAGAPPPCPSTACSWPPASWWPRRPPRPMRSSRCWWIPLASRTSGRGRARTMASLAAS